MNKRHRDKDSHTKPTPGGAHLLPGLSWNMFGTNSISYWPARTAQRSPQPESAGLGCQRTQRCQMSPKVGAEHLCTGAGTGERSFDKGGFAGQIPGGFCWGE